MKNIFTSFSKCNILILALIGAISIYSISAGQDDTVRVAIDTLYFNNYFAIKNKLLLEEYWFEFEWDIFYKDKKILTSPSYFPIVDIQNLSCYSHIPNDSCHCKDITGDDICEIIISIPSGGNNGAEDIFIYSLDSTANSIGKFDGLNKIFGSLRNIDGDSIPEVIFYDLQFDCWPEGCFGAPRPMLIWKWTGNGYKLANFEFSSYLLESKGWKDEPDIKKTIQWWVVTFYKKPGYAEFPPLIAHVMIEYIYAGKFAEADSAFNAIWPSEVDGKDIYHKEIWDLVKSGPFWDDLLKSDR
jgi:hypothetical protein